MNLNGKRQFVFKLILVLVVAITASQMVISNYQWNQNEDKVPVVVSGNYVVFYEELSSTMRITEIEATEQYVYYLYPDFDVIAVYDWIGTYQYSLAFHPANNSVMRIRCDDGLLYILDSEYYEYVFSGNELLCKYEVTDITNTIIWFNQKTESNFVIEGTTLYSKSGSKIMELPGVPY